MRSARSALALLPLLAGPSLAGAAPFSSPDLCYTVSEDAVITRVECPPPVPPMPCGSPVADDIAAQCHARYPRTPAPPGASPAAIAQRDARLAADRERCVKIKTVSE